MALLVLWGGDAHRRVSPNPSAVRQLWRYRVQSPREMQHCSKLAFIELLPQLGTRIGVGLVSAIASATIGAIILLVVLRVVRRGGR